MTPKNPVSSNERLHTLFDSNDLYLYIYFPPIRQLYLTDPRARYILHIYALIRIYLLALLYFIVSLYLCQSVQLE